MPKSTNPWANELKTRRKNSLNTTEGGKDLCLTVNETSNAAAVAKEHRRSGQPDRTGDDLNAATAAAAVNDPNVPDEVDDPTNPKSKGALSGQIRPICNVFIQIGRSFATIAAVLALPAAPRHKGQALKQVHILLVL